MNEFVGKKLGEVMAFSQLGIELFERGEEALKTVIEDYDRVVSDFGKQSEEIQQLAETHGVDEITMAKAEATGSKLRGMMETYIGDEWDNTAELLEWMGFFEGAALVHWKLVEGASTTLESDEMQELAQFGANLHQDLLGRAQEAIMIVGSARAQE